MSESEADTVELELSDAPNIVVPADALEDALDGLPNKPEDEVAMITDSVVVAGDGDDCDDCVYVLRPSDSIKIGSDTNTKYWFGFISELYDMVVEQQTLSGAEYVRENIAGGGSFAVEQVNNNVYITSYVIQGSEMERAVADERMELKTVEPTEYRDDDGAKMLLVDTEAE